MWRDIWINASLLSQKMRSRGGGGHSASLNFTFNSQFTFTGLVTLSFLRFTISVAYFILTIVIFSNGRVGIFTNQLGIFINKKALFQLERGQIYKKTLFSVVLSHI